MHHPDADDDGADPYIEQIRDAPQDGDEQRNGQAADNAAVAPPREDDRNQPLGLQDVEILPVQGAEIVRQHVREHDEQRVEKRECDGHRVGAEIREDEQLDAEDEHDEKYQDGLEHRRNRELFGQRGVEGADEDDYQGVEYVHIGQKTRADFREEQGFGYGEPDGELDPDQEVEEKEHREDEQLLFLDVEGFFEEFRHADHL